MPELTPGRPLRSRVPTLLVENRLEVGAWRFRLTAVDDAGNESAPAEIVVRVVAGGRPVIPPDVVLPVQPPVVTRPRRPRRPPR